MTNQEREEFETYWNSLKTDGSETSEALRVAEYAARNAWQAGRAAERAEWVRDVGAEESSERQRSLRALADRIDHEELWRWAGMDHHKMTPEQKDRLDAGVNLRRFARLWAPGRWIVFRPIGMQSFSADTLDKAFEMAKKDEERRLASASGESAA